MAENEHDLIEAMCADFKNQHTGSFWRKIHGSKFQAGFPDVVCALPDVAALTEFKWCKDDRQLMGPFAYLVTEMLTGLQFAELTMLGALSDTCPLRARVLVGCEIIDEDDNNKRYELAMGCDVADLPRYRGFSAVNLAQVALVARATQAWAWDPAYFKDGLPPPGLEFQLRAHGERWRVGALVLGMRRYQVFNVRKTAIDSSIDYD